MTANAWWYHFTGMPRWVFLKVTQPSPQAKPSIAGLTGSIGCVSDDLEVDSVAIRRCIPGNGLTTPRLIPDPAEVLCSARTILGLWLGMRRDLELDLATTLWQKRALESLSGSICGI